MAPKTPSSYILIIFFISYKFYIYSIANVLHSFVKYTVIHKLEEVFFK